MNAVEVFGPEQVTRARRYHRPLYAALAADVVLSLGVAAVVAFLGPSDLLARALPWWAAVPALAALVVIASFLVRLPLSFWRGYARERRWGFSTQSLGGWLADRAKALTVALVLTGGAVTVFLAIVRALPRAWPAPAAAAGAALVLLLSFVAPVVLEPVFNRFAPLADEVLAADLRALSERAGVPVREVLLADASRRTRKENAYVSGLGRTRRVVLYDTLLRRAEPRQIRLVVAHELGHRRLRHVAKGTALGMAGMTVAVALLWSVLGSGRILEAVGADSPADPRVVPLILLVVGVMEVAALPLGSAVSRRWERAADRFSLDVVGDPEVFEATHRDLAIANLSDLDPPRPIYLVAFTHPTPTERIAMARRLRAPSRPTTA